MHEELINRARQVNANICRSKPATYYVFYGGIGYTPRTLFRLNLTAQSYEYFSSKDGIERYEMLRSHV